jgi:hypothetical protein
MRHVFLWSILAAGCDCGSRSDDVIDAGPILGEDGSIDGGVPTGELREGPICTPGGWCWETPLPGGGILSGLWVPAPGHLVAGSGTYMFHIDDGTIRHAAPPTLTPYLNGIPVWGAAPDDVWANAFGSLIHFDGRRWTASARGTGFGFATGISGTSRSDVFATGFGAIGHYDGAGWTSLDTSAFPDANFTDVWAIAPGEAIVVGVMGAESLVLHVQGTTLTEIDFPTAMGGAVGVYASSTEDIWVAAGNTLWRREGTTWSNVMTATSFVLTTSGLWGSGPSDVWLVARDSVIHFSGSAMNTIPVPGARNLTAIAGTSPTDVWATDYDGQIHHYDGSSWSVRFKATVAPTDFHSISVGDDGVGWAAGPLGLAERDPAMGTWSGVPSPTMSVLTGVARAGGESFLFAMGGSYRRQGGGWELVIGGAGLTDACATDDGTIWAVGDRLARYEGGEWVTLPVATPLGMTRIVCRGSEAWALPDPNRRSDDGVGVMRYDGSEWALVGLSSIGHLLPLRAATALAANDGWVIAETESGTAIVMRYDGVEWRQLAAAPPTVRGVGGSSPADVWLVGDGGVARHWNGTSLVVRDAPGAPDFAWVDAAGGTVTALARNGVVWRWSGTTWSTVGMSIRETGYSSDEVYDAAFADGDVFAVGEYGEAYRFSGTTWERVGTFNASRVDASEAGGVWFVDSSRRVHRWTGTAVEEVDPSFSDAQDIIVAQGGTEVFATGWRGVYRLSGGTFTREHEVESLDFAVFGYGADSMWLLEPASSSRDLARVHRRTTAWAEAGELARPIGFGQDESGMPLVLDADLAMWRREATGWRRVIEPREGFEGRGVAGHVYGLSDAWVLALGGLLHFDGGAWSMLADPVGLNFQALEATPSGTLYAAGGGASVVRRSR